MSGTASQLPAHKGLRGEVLLELKRAQPRTAKQLADTLGVSPDAVRHHLKELEAESLIAYGREQRGVGAPTFAYRLSAAGEALFPRAYEATLTELLERVTEKAGRGAAVELFRDHYRELTHRSEEHTSELQSRLHLVCRLLLEKKKKPPHTDTPSDAAH